VSTSSSGKLAHWEGVVLDEADAVGHATVAASIRLWTFRIVEREHSSIF